jgi:hypothetical protein
MAHTFEDFLYRCSKCAKLSADLGFGERKAGLCYNCWYKRENLPIDISSTQESKELHKTSS